MKQASILLGLALLLVASPGLGAERPAASDTVEAVVVEVPVHVLDGQGNPVRDLTAADFEIVDGRKKQQITGFEMIDLKRVERAAEGSAGRIPVAARRHIFLLFDLSLSEPSAIIRAREAAMDVVNESLHPSDLVAVATYSEARGARLVLGFSPDRQQVAMAVDTLGLADLPETVNDPLGFMIAQAGATAERGTGTADGAAPGGGINTNMAQILAGEMSDLAIGTSRVNREEMRNRAMAMARGLQEIASLLNSVDGRKHVVLFSEGMDSSVFFGTQDASRRAELGEAAIRGEYWEIDSDETLGSGASLSMLEEMMEEFRRADVSIQAVDIGWLRADQAAASRGRQDALFTMASQTGGELFSNFSDLGQAMDEVLSRTEVVYLLAFQPEDLELDGSYHRLRVKLEGGPKGARLVHRPGYYAPKPYDQRNPMERRLEAADSVLDGPDRGEMLSGVLAAPVKPVGGISYVPVLLELDGPSLLQAAQNGVTGLEIYGYAIDRDGRVADFFSRTLGLEVEKVRPVLESSGLKYFGTLDLAPGDYALRVLVRDAQSGATSRRTFSLTVPAAGAGAVVSVPLVPEPNDKWIKVLEDGIREREYPFMLQGAPFMPAARPVLAPGSESLVSLIAYNLPSDLGTVGGELIADNGSSERIAVDLVEVGTGSPALLVAKLNTGAVAPGAYTLVVRVGAIESSIPVVVEG